MEWLRTDCFCFKMQRPNYIEEDHLMVMGHREDRRVYYAWIPIPEHPPARPAAYIELKNTFNRFLNEPVTTEPYTADGYALLVEQTIHKYKAFVLDVFPDGN